MSTTKDVTVYDLIVVLKMREATFSNYAGILTGSTSGDILVGDIGQTYFYYFAQNNIDGQLSYWKNSVEYTFDNQQAPMSEFAIVHTRFTDGVSVPNLQIGRQRDYTDRYANVDLGPIAIADQLMPLNLVAETVEALAARYRINVIE
jgi:hypothetical protein